MSLYSGFYTTYRDDMCMCDITKKNATYSRYGYVDNTIILYYLRQAENRATEYERMVTKLQKEVDKLEGTVTHNFLTFTMTQNFLLSESDDEVLHCSVSRPIWHVECLLLSNSGLDVQSGSKTDHYV